MSWRQRALLVAPTVELARNLSRWLTDEGYRVALVASFAEGKASLCSDPDLLVAEVRLGEYNGLHLASHARARGVPAVVVGDADVVLERDAHEMHIAYAYSDVEPERLRRIVAEAIADGGVSNDTRRLNRPRPSGGLAFVSADELSRRGTPARRTGRPFN